MATPVFLGEPMGAVRVLKLTTEKKTIISAINGAAVEFLTTRAENAEKANIDQSSAEETLEIQVSGGRTYRRKSTRTTWDLDTGEEATSNSGDNDSMTFEVAATAADKAAIDGLRNQALLVAISFSDVSGGHSYTEFMFGYLSGNITRNEDAGMSVYPLTIVGKKMTIKEEGDPLAPVLTFSNFNDNTGSDGIAGEITPSNNPSFTIPDLDAQILTDLLTGKVVSVDAA